MRRGEPGRPTAKGATINATITSLEFLDERLGSTRTLRKAIRKVFPDHWSFMLGEIALYSFVVLLITGTFLTLWFRPDMTEVVYHGSYRQLDGVRMSEAYASTLDIGFEVRGGLLVRQIHHWAALLFIAAIMAHMLRVFFTGAYRKPRDLNWLVGLAIFTIVLVEGLFGYSLPDDGLSGAGLRVTAGVVQALPLVGTYLLFFLFGGEYPGTDIVPRMFTIHVLLIPGVILALVVAHILIMWHQTHSSMPVRHHTERQTHGYPFFPVFVAKTGAFFLFTFGVLALLAAVAQINPVWLYGPSDPAVVSSGSQPDFYLGFLEGALRVMPAWETTLWGHTVSWNVLVPGLVPLGLLVTGAAFWPWLERWATGDRGLHHVNDRPRNAPVRTSAGVAVTTCYAVLWLAGANDVISDRFHVSLYATTWFFRVALFTLPAAAYQVTKRLCLGLQRRDAAALAHGHESGVIVMTPEGGYTGLHREVPPDMAVVLSGGRGSAPIEETP
ncbi:cytochrome bc1 complex cytochrome b subunit [Actinomadura macrotermitis]|uniref:Cytochrome bc1 complex cytochrome b subunit n=1 Tax=Actinomadura macrotermitis TaxID=2585200 RepID=A0A7K0BYR0_9ACTN|nr:ubiquinol-cytochrome c reductase cytochrome b subunit [Actinomadura macrotermitis]MQY06320.1 Cytochrome bc1 complex cytochrome b subunit [Actinomadura macrotermitis]